MPMKPKLTLPAQSSLTIIQDRYGVEIQGKDMMLETASISISYDRLESVIKCLVDIQTRKQNKKRKREELS